MQALEVFMRDAPRIEKLLRSADGIDFINIRCCQLCDQALGSERS